ncbi:MAG TPA: 2-nitropropane dioxygenase [Thermoanaerobaculia bacterium]|nr:2-nitropropane dioxygenase [Thermoanaerobaculia bacterium]
MAKNFEITCPCCDAQIVIDRISGEVLMHKAKERKSSQSLEAMVSGLQEQKTEIAKRFEKEMESQKDRSRILEEKFKEALERADKDKPYINPMDLD